MTPKEKRERLEWEAKVQGNQAFLDALSVGDEIVVTNTYNVPTYQFGNLVENKPFDPEASIPGIGDQTEEICEYRKVRGITEDGSFIIGTNIYDKTGKPEKVAKGYNRTELWKPTPELQDLTDLLLFVKTVRNFSFYTWKRFNKDKINDLQTIMKSEVDRSIEGLNP